MSEPRDDLREALALWLADELFDENVGPEHYRYADAIFADPLAPIVSENTVLRAANAELGTGDWTDVRQLEAEARISALQAEVEKAWLTECAALTFKNERDKAETERDAALADCSRLQNDYADAMAGLRSEMERADRLSAEVERLQKVEGERERGRDPKGSGSRPSDQAPAGLAPSGFDPSRIVFPAPTESQAKGGWQINVDYLAELSESAERIWPAYYELEATEALLRSIDFSKLVAPCDQSGEAGEPSGLDPQGESTVTGAARQAPSDNPLTETKEGSDAR